MVELDAIDDVTNAFLIQVIHGTWLMYAFRKSLCLITYINGFQIIEDLAINVGIIMTDTGTSSSFPNMTIIVTIE